MTGAAAKRPSKRPSLRAPGSGVVPSSKRHSILLVDPDRASRTPLGHALSDHHALYEAEDGLVALRLASMIQNLALVISAVSLPTFNGIDLVKLFKSHDALKHIPFIFLTEGESANDVHRLISAGARVCLNKSLAPRTIARLVDKLAGK